MKKFVFWALASHGPGISGGDRIYIELARRWSKRYPVTVVTWREGIAMMTRNGLGSSKRISFHSVAVPNLGFTLTYLTRIVAGVVTAMTLTLKDNHQIYLYTASEFWMDALPGAILKLRYPALKWVATWYQTAPSPVTGFGQGRFRFAALVLWLSQLPIRPILTKYADYILVNNDLEKKVFPKSKVIVVLGAVNTNQVAAYLTTHRQIKKKYAAVFQGRFHPQKGVEELVDIWWQVVAVMPEAKLAMIGDGPLMAKVRQKVADLGLEKNIELFGFVFDGPVKYRIFAQSQLVVHPAFFDSGGMATAEAMAFGIPAVGFNLPAYETYYPVGMIKVPAGDLAGFAKAIVDLLKAHQRRSNLGQQARKFIQKSYSWDYRATQILQQIVERTDWGNSKAKSP